MNIRTRITLQFLYISSLLLFLTSVSIYFYSSEIRKKEFYERLSQKAHLTAQLYNRLPINDIENQKFIDHPGLGFLPEEATYIYNNEDALVFQSTNLPLIASDSKLLNRILLFRSCLRDSWLPSPSNKKEFSSVPGLNLKWLAMCSN